VALVVVQPATMIRWHNRLETTLANGVPRRSPPIRELRELIRRMARENCSEERIANEPLLKLGFDSPRTVRK
jgi:hypothetical protein